MRDVAPQVRRDRQQRRNFKGLECARTAMPSREDVIRALSGVKDPELGKDVVALHMIEGVEVKGGKVTFTLNLTTPACPLRTRLEEAAKGAVAGVRGVTEVEMKTGSSVYATRDYSQADVLKGVKNVIAVASGKGGVGKSTVAVNLACALASSGARVGILDADVYGPNIPLMMGVKSPPEVKDDKVVPPVAHGVKVASLGFFYSEETPVIWRGPLVAGAVRQLLTQVDWGELDYLICDLPPGCLPAGTMVTMANNAPRPIEQVRAGDFVMSYDGHGLSPRRVLGVIPQGRQEVFRLVTAGRTIVASANHPFLVRVKPDGYAWRRLDQLKPRDRILVVGAVRGGTPLRLPDVAAGRSPVRLPAYMTNDLARTAGRFVGDGSARERGAKGSREFRVREPMGGSFEEDAGLRSKASGDEPGFAVGSQALVDLFTALDLVSSAREKSIPDWAFSLPLDQRRSFITGFAQAGRSISRGAGGRGPTEGGSRTRVVSVAQETASVGSTDEGVARRLHELCLMSGYRASNLRRSPNEGSLLRAGRTGASGARYEFEFPLRPDEEEFRLARIEGIDRLGAEETYDLQVDEYHNFVADGMVVHNTGDASLTLAQTVPLGGILVVTTPQEAALSIAAKALAMFKRLDVPILGVVENMSYFVCPHCGERTAIFSSGGGKKMAAERGVDYLGEIPLGIAIREHSDRGEPIADSLPESAEAVVFKELAYKVAGVLSIVAFAKMKK